MGRKKVSSERMHELLDEFKNNIMPWCEDNQLSLHKAFEISRTEAKEIYSTLSELWSTAVGKAYLQSVFRSYGGIIRKK